jgi:signal transduction histidine kinase
VAADHVPVSAERIRRRGARIAAAFVLMALLMLGVGAWVLADSQSRDREQLRNRYSQGAVVAASLIDALFQSATQTQAQVLAQQFGGAVTTQALDAYNQRSQTIYTAILDGTGAVVAKSSGAPAQPGSAVLEAAEQTKQGFTVSDEVDVGGTPAVESAFRFPISKDGKQSRYIVSASPLKFFSAFLSGSIQPLVQLGGDAYILDGKGKVLGAVSKSSPKHPRAPSPSLIEQVNARSSATYKGDGRERFFAGRPVTNTHWHVAVTIPTAELYDPVSGVSRWLPWVILAILTLALLSIAVLIRRSLEGAARLAVVNSQLEASQDRLRDRAVELQRSNAELQRSNAELEQFAYVASHDLSAPLRAVAGFSQLLGVRYKGKLDGDADQFITHMQDGVDRMQRIIDDLLAYSRVDRSGLQPEPLDLDAVLAEVLHSLGPEISERGAKVTSDPLGQACGEPGQLAQALQNLIANGLKFTPAGRTPEVHVSVRREGGRVYVSVRDNGIGIDPDHGEQIFKMFQRLHSADDYPGTGIGLAIVKKIIDRHGGRVTVEAAPGGGTAFTFDVPGELPKS